MEPLQELNTALSVCGIEAIHDVDICPERGAYLQALKTTDSADKKLKALRHAYFLAFHHYLSTAYPHLLYEIGEDKTYWNYDPVEGVYVELNFSSVRNYVLKLLIDDGLSSEATEANTKTILARYRSLYPERGVLYDDFDHDDSWFHANNGWVNLSTLAYEPHTPTRRSRIKSAVDYDAEAECPVYDKFLESDLKLKQDQVRVIDQFSGLVLTNDIRYQKMLTLLGRPGCGKSTLLNCWSNVLGAKAIERKLTELQSDSMRFGGSSFMGATLCWFDEVDVKRAEMGNTLGTLITGQTINVERKGINGIVKALNTVKCVLTANKLPMTAEVGIYRRLIMINIEGSFVDDGTVDTEMPHKLALESSGVLNRMFEGLRDLRKMRGFTMIAGHDELIEQYKAQSDTIAEFLDEYFDVATSESFIETNVLLGAYRGFAEGNLWTRTITPQKFGRLLATQPLTRFAHIAPKKVTDGVRGWSGLKLKYGYSFNTSTNAIESEKESSF